MDMKTIKVLCQKVTGKAIKAKSKSGNSAWFPRSKVQLVEGELKQGENITLQVPEWLLDQVRQGQTQPKEIPFTAKVLVTGIRLDASEKAVQVKCDGDTLTRWFPFSKIDMGGVMPGHGQPIKAIVPAWLLKFKAGGFPSWVEGAIQ